MATRNFVVTTLVPFAYINLARQEEPNFQQEGSHWRASRGSQPTTLASTESVHGSLRFSLPILVSTGSGGLGCVEKNPVHGWSRSCRTWAATLLFRIGILVLVWLVSSHRVREIFFVGFERWAKIFLSLSYFSSWLRHSFLFSFNEKRCWMVNDLIGEKFSFKLREYVSLIIIPLVQINRGKINRRFVYGN